MTPSPPVSHPARRTLLVAAVLCAAAAAIGIFYMRRAALAAPEPHSAPMPQPGPAVKRALDGRSEPAAPERDPAPIFTGFPGPEDSLYNWKSADVFRFDYAKSITVSQLDESGKLSERTTAVDGFLILEMLAPPPISVDTSSIKLNVAAWNKLQAGNSIDCKVLSSSADRAQIEILGTRFDIRANEPLLSQTLRLKVESRGHGTVVLRVQDDPAGTAFRMRVDSPRVTLPEIRTFSSQADGPETQAGRDKSVERAMEGAIKNASWIVMLHPNGLAYIHSRSPANLREWFKDVETAAAWRRKTLDDNLPRLIEQDLGLKAPSHDRDLLLYLGRAAPPGLASADVLRARREVTGSAPAPGAFGEGEKLAVEFRRVKPEGNEPYWIPGLSGKEKISARLAAVHTAAGKAVFDTRLGMIDTLNEDYTLKLQYQSGKRLKLDQDVRIQYRLKRLAPPINRP